MMKRLLCSLLVASFGANARAATSAIFANDLKSAVVSLNNETTADATFLWDLIGSAPVRKGDFLTKSLRTNARHFVADCKRSVTSDAQTTCEVTFKERRGGPADEVIIDRDEGFIGVNLTGTIARDLRAKFSRQTGVFDSPDQRFSVCLDCGENGTDLAVSWFKDLPPNEPPPEKPPETPTPSPTPTQLP